MRVTFGSGAGLLSRRVEENLVVMKLLVLRAIFTVLFCQLASGFVMTPSAFGGSSVVSLKQVKFYDKLCYNRR